MPVHLPPLRDRGDDVNVIAQQMLVSYAKEEGKMFADLSEGVRDLFRALPWPGNVRQLLNVLRNVVVLHDAPSVTLDMLPSGLAQERDRAPPQIIAEPVETEPVDALTGLVGLSLADLERRFIEATLDTCGGSVPRAARILDISPSTLYRKREAWQKADAGR